MSNIFILSLWVCCHVWLNSLLVVLDASCLLFFSKLSSSLLFHLSNSYFITNFNPFQKDVKKLYKRLTHSQSDPNQQKYRNVGLFGHKFDLVDHYGKKLENIEENLRVERSEVSLAAEVCACTCSFSFFWHWFLLYFPTFIRILYSILNIIKVLMSV